jgi:hypothetical protein
MPVLLDRRGFLLLGGGALLAGCTSGGQASTSPGSAGSSSVATTSPRPPSPTASPSSAPSSGPSSAPPAQAPPSLPKVTPWAPDRGDVTPAAKAAAARHVERHGNGPHRAIQVIEAQFGGLLPGSASVLAVCRSWHLADGRVVPGGATYDVRLSRSAAGWHTTKVHPSHPGPARRRLSPDARAVLRSDRIDLPPAARADVGSGRVHDSVLAAMLRMSHRYRIGVSVVRSGHPLYVFGTDRLSDHPQGRAFDTFRIDEHLVVDPHTPRRLVTSYMEAAAAAGSYNVGGPYLLGAAPQWFSDRTHHDHVHAGFAE